MDRRSDTAFARFSNAIAVGAAEAPTIEESLRFVLQQICAYVPWALGRARVAAHRILNREIDLWHFGLSLRSESLSPTFGGPSRHGEEAVAVSVFKRVEHCTRCSSPVVVHYRGSQTAIPSPSTETILCPWCGHNWTLEIPGQMRCVESAYRRFTGPVPESRGLEFGRRAPFLFCPGPRPIVYSF
jgi:hypothetical protein